MEEVRSLTIKRIEKQHVYYTATIRFGYLRLDTSSIFTVQLLQFRAIEYNQKVLTGAYSCCTGKC